MAPQFTASSADLPTKIIALIFSNGLLAGMALLFFLPGFFSGAKGMFYVWAPYYALNFIMKLEHKDGWQNETFAWSFPPLYYLRKHIELSAEVPSLLKKKDGQFIFAIFPHGCGSDFRVLLQGMLPEIFPFHNKIRSLAASVLFCIPFVRELTLLTGCIDASPRVAEGALKNGRTILVLPGGEAEQLLTVKGVEKVYLRKRKGFVKLAMRHNVPLVPAYVFGSNDLFETSKFLFGLRWWLMKRFGVCLPFCRGYFGSLCPLPIKNTIVFGEPIHIPAVEGDITPAQLDAAHELFTSKLTELFNKNKARFGMGDRELIIV